MLSVFFLSGRRGRGIITLAAFMANLSALSPASASSSVVPSITHGSVSPRYDQTRAKLAAEGCLCLLVFFVFAEGLLNANISRPRARET